MRATSRVKSLLGFLRCPREQLEILRLDVRLGNLSRDLADTPREYLG